MDEIKDPYVVYLSYAMGRSPAFKRTARHLLAASFGKQHSDKSKTAVSERLLPRHELMQKIAVFNSREYEAPAE